MLKINNQSRMVYKCPITQKTSIKVEERFGTWGVISAYLTGNGLYALLESEDYGDETAFLLVKLPKFRNLYLVRKDSSGNFIDEIYYLRQKLVISETYDDIITALIDEDLINEENDGYLLTDEEINNMEDM